MVTRVTLFYYALFHTSRMLIFGKPVTEYQYGAILDGGSTSTKTHLYKWTKTNNKSVLLPQIGEIHYNKFQPGVSKFIDQLEGLGDYFATILEDLNSHCPENRSLPVYFLATAGLRLLGETKAQSILDEIRKVFGNTSINPFHIPEEHVQILSGEEEALFSWITINYMLGTFQNNQNTYGLVEMGGSSAQLAFEPEVPIMAGKVTVHIGNITYNVYTHSYLSYGGTAMKERIQNYLLKENPHAIAVIDPCMLKGDNTKVIIDGKELKLSGGGNVSQCQDILRHYLERAPGTACSPKPCSIGGIYSPSIPHNSKFIGLSTIYNTASELRLLNNGSVLNTTQLKEEAVVYCLKTIEEAQKIYGINPKWASSDCRNGLYIPMFLQSLGLTEDIEYQLSSVKYINGDFVAWSLGSILLKIENGELT